MDLDLTDEQRLLRETTDRFIASACPVERVRELADGSGRVNGGYWRQGAQLGWFSLLASESSGGGSLSDNGLFDAAIVAQARGGALQPGPFVGTNVVVTALTMAACPDQQARVLAPLLAGDGSASWAAAGEIGGGWDPGSGVRLEDRRGGYVLTGAKTLVQDADTCGWLLVTVADDEGLTQVLVGTDSPGIHIERLDGLDVTRTFCEVRFDQVVVEPEMIVGRPGEAGEVVNRQLQVACVLTVAESTGAMERDLAAAVQYAQDRIAFGRPIGSFQAVKHLLADASLWLEMSKAMAGAAAWAVGRASADAAEVASMAKAFVGDAGIDLAESCFQVFGGIGFTWDHDQHLYLRRLTTDAFLYGDPTWHRERLCQLAGV